MTDIVKIIKQLILSNPSLKQKLLEQGIITEKDEDIVILKPEAFEIVGSNSADTAGEKQEWLKQTEKSGVSGANNLPGSILPGTNDTNSKPGAMIRNTNPGAGSQNTRPVRKSAPETKNPGANGKTEKTETGRLNAPETPEKSVEKTHSSKFDEDPKHLEIVGSRDIK